MKLPIAQIIEGHAKEALGLDTDISEARLRICHRCPLFSNALGGMCNSRLWLNVETGDVSDAIIWTETTASYEWILNAFEARFEDFEAKTYLEGEHGFIFIQQQKNGMKGEKLLDLRLGIWPDTVELFERHGYQIIPRSVTEKNMNGTKLFNLFRLFQSKQLVPVHVMCTGTFLRGFSSRDLFNEEKRD